MPEGNQPEEVKRIKGIPFFGLAGEYTTGNIYFVDSGIGVNDVGSYGDHPDRPFATIDYAIGYCDASNGDIIYAMPGHAETVSAAAGINMDVAGVSLIGLGNADNRPTLTYSATTSDLDFNADDCRIKNFKFVSAIDSLENFITVGANDTVIEDCLFVTSNTYEALCFINLETTYDNLTVRRCDFRQPTDPAGTDAAAGTGIIYCVDSENIFLEDIYFVGSFETGFFHNKTTKCQNLWMRRIYGYNALSTAVPITLVADSTGGITDSLITTPAATDIAVANIVGVPGDKFFIGRTANFGNDSGGGQLAAFGDAEAS